MTKKSHDIDDSLSWSRSAKEIFPVAIYSSLVQILSSSPGLLLKSPHGSKVDHMRASSGRLDDYGRSRETRCLQQILSLATME